MKTSNLAVIGQLQRSWVSTRMACLFAAALLLSPSIWASDPIGVFALIDKVVFEPNERAPERIQVWGAFALADRSDPKRNGYHAPESGYLYFTLPAEKADVARKEWEDLQRMAGKKEVIGFGSRHEAPKPTVRSAGVKPADPDPYVLGWGMAKMSNRDKNYAPIKTLLAHQKPAKTEAK